MNKPEAMIENIYVTNTGVTKKIGYKTMRGLIQILKRANKNCKKQGITAQYRITLPIKP